MDWQYDIIYALFVIAHWFSRIAEYCADSFWPLTTIADFFYGLHDIFFDTAVDFGEFFAWVRDVADKIGQVLSWEEIWNLLTSHIPFLEDVLNWFQKWWNNVTSVVTSWWSATQFTVRGWIDAAVSGFQSLVNQVSSSLASLQTAWDDFKGRIPTLDGVTSWWRNWIGNVLSEIESWWSGAVGEVQGLIDSAFLARDSWWAGWQEMRENVMTFFTDPVEFIWDRFADWFLGPEE